MKLRRSYIIALLATLSFALFSTNRVQAQAGYVFVDSTITDAFCSVVTGGGQCVGDGSIHIEIQLTGTAIQPLDFVLFGPTTIFISDTNTTEMTFGGLCPGNYFLIVNDGNNTNMNQFLSAPHGGPVQFIVDGSPAISLSNTINNPVCEGEDNGSIELGINGGTAPFNINWSTGDSKTNTNDPGDTLADLGAGNYSVTVDDFFGCAVSDTFVINAGDSLNAHFFTGTACQNEQITFTDSSTATNPITSYSWNFADGTPGTAGTIGPHDVTFNTSGNKSIQLIVSDGTCTDTSTQSVTVLPSPLPNATADTSICSGDTIQISASGGINYNWSNISFISDTSIANPNVSPSSDASYIVTVTDVNGCSSTDTVDITVNGTPTINISSDTTICLGDTAQLSAGGGSNYLWSPATTLTSSNTATTGAFPNTTTTYQVIVQNGALCEDSATVTVNVNLPPTITVSNDTSICLGDSAQLNASGGTNYTWTPNLNITNNTISNPIVFPVASTNYLVSVENADGCSDTASVNVTVNALPTITTSNDTTICIGDTIPLFASGGTNYSWFPTASLTDAGASNTDAFPTVSTTYTVTVTDNAGCSDSADITINVNTLPSITTSGDQTICENDTALIWAQGGTNYTWTPTTNLFTPTNDSTLANPGTTTSYTVTVSDANNCSDDATVTVNVNTLPNVTVSNDTSICVGDSAFLNAGGAINYVWTPAASLDDPNISNPTATPPGTTTYTVVGTDGNNCSNSANVTVTVVSPPAVNTSGDQTICINDTAQIWADGGTSYTWTPTTNLFTPTNDSTLANPSANTTYTVRVEDAIGCFTDASVTVFVNALPTITTSGDQTICENDTALIWAQGGTNYTWTPNTDLFTPTNDSTLANPGTTTTYTVTVSDANNCSDDATVTVNVNTLPNVTVSNDTSICVGDSAFLNAGGAINYVWTPAASLDDPNISNPIATPPGTTTYTVVGTDGNNCSNLANVTVTVVSPPVVNTSGDQTICINDTAQIWADGGTSYTWTPTTNLFTPTNDSTLANPSANTTYTVRVEDAIGCFTDASVTVFVNALPTITTSGDQTICENDTALIWAQGGTNYTWTPNTDLFTPTNDSTLANPGTTTTYTVTVSDASNCSDDTTVTVNVNTLPAVTTSNDTTICLGDTLALFATGGISFSWSPNFNINDITSSTPLVWPNTDTAYVVTVTDNNGCENTGTTNVSVLTTINLTTIPSGSDTICHLDTIPLQAFGATQFTWSPGTSLSDSNISNPLAFPTNTVTYELIGTTPAGCADTTTLTLVVRPPLNVSISASDTSLCLGDTSSLNATAGFVNYQWTPDSSLSTNGVANVDATPPVSTTYTLIASDNIGCRAFDTLTINVNALPLLAVTNDTLICAGDSLTLSASGATTYLWTPTGSLSDSSIANPIAFPNSNTTFYVTGTDGNNCSSTDSIIITVSPQIVSQNSGDQEICLGDTVTIWADGGTSYTWTPTTNLFTPNNDSTLANPTSTTTYHVHIENLAGCELDTQVTVTVNALPLVTTSGNQRICIGDTALIWAQGGISYVWNPGGTPVNATEDSLLVTPGLTTIYSITVEDSAGCRSDTNMLVQVDTLPEINLSADNDSLCFGDSITIFSNSDLTSTVIWSPDSVLVADTALNNVAFPNSTQFVYATAISPEGCVNSDSLELIVLSEIVIDMIADDTICIGDSILLNPGTQGASTFQWEPQSSGTIINPDSMHTQVVPNNNTNYTLVASNELGCSTSDSVFIHVDLFPAPSIFVSNDSICEGDSAQLIASGALTYNWTPGTSLSAPNNDSTFAFPDTTTTYTLSSLTVSGCIADTNITIFVDPVPAPVAQHSSDLCFGDTVMLTVSNSISATWSGPALFDTIGDTVFATPDSSSYYVVSATNSLGCGHQDSVFVTVDSTINLTITLSKDTICVGDSSIIDVFGALNYFWHAPQSSTLSDNTSSNPIATPLGTTTYIVTGSMPSGCSTTDSVTLVANPVANITTSGDTSICNGDSVLLVASGMQSYEWSPAAILSDPTNDSTYAFPFQDTTFFVLSNDTGVCSSVGSVHVQVLPGPTGTLDIADNVLCHESSTTINVNLSQGFTQHPEGSFSFDNGLTFTNSTNHVFEGNTPGDTIITVIMRDEVACGVSAPIIDTITVLAPITFEIDTIQFPECTGPPGEFNLFNLAGGNGEPYLVDFNGTTTTMNSSDIQNYNNLLPGIYNISIEDNGGCRQTELLNFNSSILFDDTTRNPSCFNSFDGEIHFSNIRGGVEPYLLSFNDTLDFDTITSFIGLPAFNYTIYIKDATGCIVPVEFTLINPTEFTLVDTILSHIVCQGSNDGSIQIELTGGSFPYIYSLNSDIKIIPSNTPAIYDSLPAGIDTLIATDGMGCSLNIPFEIKDADAFETYLSEAISPTDCFTNDGSAQIDSISGGSGNFEFSILGGTFKDSLTFVNEDLDQIGLGTYTVLTRDLDLGCIDTSSFTINYGLDLSGVSVENTLASCAGDDAQATLLGTGSIGAPLPYTFELRNGTGDTVIVPLQNDTTFTDLSSGDYIIVIQDNIGCEYPFDFNIPNNSPVSINDVNITSANCGLDNGSATLITSGGAPPFRYELINSQNTSDTIKVNNPVFEDLAGGNYTVRIVETANPSCSFGRNIVIPVSTADAIINVDSTLCPEGEDGSVQILTLISTSGTSIFEFAVDDTSSFSTDSIYNDLLAGQHVLYIKETDTSTNFSCIYPDVQTLNDSTTVSYFEVFEPDTIAATFSTTPSQKGINIGTITVDSVGGGTPGYLYSLNESPTFTPFISGDGDQNTMREIAAGEHLVTIQDANGCERIFLVEVKTEFFIPNVFTPNNDGKNDVFFVHNLQDNSTLRVFDRWGNIVYENFNYQNDWDGGRLTDGTYFFELIMPDRSEKGWVQIVR